MRLLIVDDQPDIRLLLGRVLRQEGFDVMQAESGPQALDQLSSGAHPDAVILDVQMPDMDGWDTLGAIRRDPCTAETPVILCTVKGRPVDEVRGWMLGCDGYIRKPFDIDELAASVRAVLARSPQERLRARQEGLREATRIAESRTRVGP